MVWASGILWGNVVGGLESGGIVDCSVGLKRFPAQRYLQFLLVREQAELVEVGEAAGGVKPSENSGER